MCDKTKKIDILKSVFTKLRELIGFLKITSYRNVLSSYYNEQVFIDKLEKLLHSLGTDDYKIALDKRNINKHYDIVKESINQFSVHLMNVEDIKDLINTRVNPIDPSELKIYKRLGLGYFKIEKEVDENIHIIDIATKVLAQYKAELILKLPGNTKRKISKITLVINKLANINSTKKIHYAYSGFSGVKNQWIDLHTDLKDLIDKTKVATY